MKKTIIIFSLFLASCINQQAKYMVEKIQFNGIILDVYVCYKNYLCVHLLNKKEKISLSSFSCVKGDNIIKGDSLVKKKYNLFVTVYRKNSSNDYKLLKKYSTWNLK